MDRCSPRLYTHLEAAANGAPVDVVSLGSCFPRRHADEGMLRRAGWAEAMVTHALRGRGIGTFFDPAAELSMMNDSCELLTRKGFWG